MKLEVDNLCPTICCGLTLPIPDQFLMPHFHRAKATTDSDVAKKSTDLSLSLSLRGNSSIRYNDTHFKRRRYRYQSVEMGHK